MNSKHLISKLVSIDQGSLLHPVCVQAIQILENAGEVKIVVSDNIQSVDHFMKIGARRLSRLNDIGEQVIGLEETLNSFKAVSGNLRAAYAETANVMIQFWLDDADVLSGCVIDVKKV